MSKDGIMKNSSFHTHIFFRNICVFICALYWSVGVAFSSTPNSITVVHTNEAGSFPVVKSGKAADIIVDEHDAEVVQIAAEALAKDIELITSVKPIVQHSVIENTPILLGTLGSSTQIDELANRGKISIAEVEDKWETFGIALVSNPFEDVSKALVIYGSDPRGTAFGVFEFSKMIGVSPWVWWADVTPESFPEIYITGESAIFGPPSVQYRGLFINDEDWGLQPWAAKNMDPGIRNNGTKGDIGPNTYERVFELMLRLKANYIWPAMHECTKAFWYYKENPELARKYQIVLGSSHAEPMLRNNVDEWVNNFREEYGKASGDWNWATNRNNIFTYWTDRAIESRNNDAVYTIGMRGVHDSGLPGYSGDENKKNALKDIIATQRNILSDNLDKPASSIPQIFCPYKETLTLYRLGLNLADDVTIAWVDDNHGYIRQLSNPSEQQRSGGAGIYYHISYWGDPEDYLWLSSTSPTLISYELSKAYALNTKKLWVINVGDIKPAEMEFQFAMDLAWDVEAWTPEKAHEYAKHWASETFGEEFSDSIAAIKETYYRLSASAKPEHVHLVQFTDSEIEQRIAEYQHLIERVQHLEAGIPERLKDAFFQLIQYPMEGAAEMNKKILGARISKKMALRGDIEALNIANEVRDAFSNIVRLTLKYNTGIADWKWNGMMNYAPRGRSQFNLPDLPTKSSINDQILPDETMVNKVIIRADQYSNKSENGQSFKLMKGLGIGAHSMTVWPLNLKTYSSSDIQTAPFIEYQVPVQKGSNTISIQCLPTFPLYSGLKLRYAVSIDNTSPVFVDLETAEFSGAWSKNVLRGFAEGNHMYESSETKNISIRVYFPDPGLVLSSLTVSNELVSPYTELMSNPSFELKAAGVLNDGSTVRGKPYGWEQKGTVPGNSFGINNDMSNLNGNNGCWYNVNQSPYAMPADFELYQEVSDLPAGEYVIRCRLAVMNGHMTNVRLFANQNVQYYGKESDYPNNLTEGENNSFAGWTGVSGMSKALLNEMVVMLSLEEGENLKLGIRSSNLKGDGSIGIGKDASNVHGGFKVDHFRIEKIDDPGTATQQILPEISQRIAGGKGELLVYLENTYQHAELSLYSLNGNHLMTIPLRNNINHVQIEQAGLYVAKLNLDSNIYVHKAVVL
jgi:hypothetical protein